MKLHFELDTDTQRWTAYILPHNEKLTRIAQIRPTMSHTFVKTLDLVSMHIMRTVMYGAECIEKRATIIDKGKFELTIDFGEKKDTSPTKEQLANREASDLTNFEHKEQETQP